MSVSVFVCEWTDLVWKDWLETATEVAEVVSVFVDLHTLTVILNFREHAIWTLFHGLLYGLACLCLEKGNGGTY